MDMTNLYQLPLPFDNLDEASGLKVQPNTADEEHQHTIEFCFWLDKSIAKNELSQQRLKCTIRHEESYIDEQGIQRYRVLVYAKAHSTLHILRQMHRYGDKAELIEPLELREKMRQEVERIYSFYQK